MSSIISLIDFYLEEIEIDQDIILYHYSKNKYNKLLTLNLQQNKKNIENNEEYENHISFFIEPPPFDLLPSIFPKDHHIWTKGNTFIEHQVLLRNINLYSWKLVETNLDNFFADYLWIDNKVYKYLFFTLRQNIKTMIGENGKNAFSLINALNKLPKNITRKKYLEFKNSKNYEENKYKYAATVPHLFVYTDKPIIVSKHKQIKL